MSRSVTAQHASAKIASFLAIPNFIERLIFQIPQREFTLDRVAAWSHIGTGFPVPFFVQV